MISQEKSGKALDVGKVPRSWNTWTNRLEETKDRFINPQCSEVKQLSACTEVYQDDEELDRAVKAWDTVRDFVNYELSVRWKTPKETVVDERGDCTDMTFLLSSILPNIGVNDSEIRLGMLHFPDGRVEEHVWSVVEGRVIDPTGSQQDVMELHYETEAVMDVTFNRKVNV